MHTERYNDESPRGEQLYDASESLEGGQDEARGRGYHSAAPFSDAHDVEDQDDDTDNTTERSRRAGRKYVPPPNNAAGRPRPRSAKRSVTRSMTEWQEMCKNMNIPTNSEQFCDFVLVFDELSDDIEEASNRTGCCTCCQKSTKELHECLQVQRTV